MRIKKNAVTLGGFLQVVVPPVPAGAKQDEHHKDDAVDDKSADVLGHRQVYGPGAVRGTHYLPLVGLPLGGYTVALVLLSVPETGAAEHMHATIDDDTGQGD